jgi:hypothetical protein
MDVGQLLWCSEFAVDLRLRGDAPRMVAPSSAVVWFYEPSRERVNNSPRPPWKEIRQFLRFLRKQVFRMQLLCMHPDFIISLDFHSMPLKETGRACKFLNYEVAPNAFFQLASNVAWSTANSLI